jgi:hypothetical protein
MANVINRSPPYTYLLWVNTPDYDTGTWLINPDLSAVAGISQQYWKVVGDTVVPMTAQEQAAVDSTALAKTLRVQKYKVSAYNGQLLSTETWYDTDNGDGTYSNMAAQTTYTYSGNALLSKTEIIYFYDGTVQSTNTYNYYQNGSNTIVKKI